MASATSIDQTETLIMRAIQIEIERAIEAEADAAADRVKQAVMAKIGELSVRLLSHYSMERMGPDLVIRVNHDGLRDMAQRKATP